MQKAKEKERNGKDLRAMYKGQSNVQRTNVKGQKEKSTGQNANGKEQRAMGKWQKKMVKAKG